MPWHPMAETTPKEIAMSTITVLGQPTVSIRQVPGFIGGLLEWASGTAQTREVAGRSVRPEWPRPAGYRHCIWRYRVRGLELGHRPARRLIRQMKRPLRINRVGLTVCRRLPLL